MIKSPRSKMRMLGRVKVRRTFFPEIQLQCTGISEPLRMSAYCVAAQTSQSLTPASRRFDLGLIGELDDLHRFGQNLDFFLALDVTDFG